jgi:hypothetical protein
MGRIHHKILEAVRDERIVVSWHADEQCEERGISPWQLVIHTGLASLVRERPRSKPNPSIILHQELADGSTVETVWAWLSETQRAKLVTVYFPEGDLDA